MNAKRFSPGVRGTVLVAALLGGAVLAWPEARAGDAQVDALCSVCTSPIGGTRRAQVFESLRKINSSASRQGLESLADCPDDAVATMAIATIGRDDYGGARAKLKSVMGDTSRSDAVRSAALVAWCNLYQKDGKDWSDVKAAVEKAAGSNQRVNDSASAVATALFGEGGE